MEWKWGRSGYPKDHWDYFIRRGMEGWWAARTTYVNYRDGENEFTVLLNRLLIRSLGLDRDTKLFLEDGSTFLPSNCWPSFVFLILTVNRLNWCITWLFIVFFSFHICCPICSSSQTFGVGKAEMIIPILLMTKPRLRKLVAGWSLSAQSFIRITPLSYKHILRASHRSRDSWQNTTLCSEQATFSLFGSGLQDLKMSSVIRKIFWEAWAG